MTTIRLLVLAACVFVVSCSAREMPVDARALALDTDPNQILVEATIRDGDGVVQVPKIILLRGQQATAFVGEKRGDSIRSGYTLRVNCADDRATLFVEHYEDGALEGSWGDSVPICPAHPASNHSK